MRHFSLLYAAIFLSILPLGMAQAVDRSTISTPVHEKVAEQLQATGKAKLDVEFESGRDTLKEGSESEIARLASYLKSKPTTKVTLEGHTDVTGTAALNKALSQNRAEMVRRVLVEKFGVDRARVSAVGIGSFQPVASNKTREGRSQNRRVIAVLEN
jgi:OOP family OmpA-OmpF porin